jgi:hypothetical protein
VRWNEWPFAASAAGVLLAVLTMQPQGASAHSGASAMAHCRATIGRPIVQTCVQSKIRHSGGLRRQHVAACRQEARPAVRACVQRTVPHLVEHCRATVGRPMVQACVRDRVQREGGPGHRFVEHCRSSVSRAVRICVRRSAAVEDDKPMRETLSAVLRRARMMQL